MKKDKLSVAQYEKITANLARVLKVQLSTSPFKQRSISMLFEKYLSQHTDFEPQESAPESGPI